MKFRKKPVTVEAIQWTGTNMDEIGEFMYGVVWSIAAGNPVIPTLEGDMTVSPGDWIIKGVKGEFYPCKPDIFEATYQPEAPELEGHADNIAKITRILNARLRPDNIHVEVTPGTDTYNIEITNKATGPHLSFWLRMKDGMIRECDGEGGSWDSARALQNWFMDAACAMHRQGINNFYLHIEEL